MRLLRKAVLLAALVPGCGDSSGQVPTTTGITTVTVTAGSSTGPADSGSSTGSTSSSGGGHAESSSAIDTSGPATPDVPDFDTIGPEKGCGKIDILFVINDHGNLELEQDVEDAADDALRVSQSTKGFVAAMQEQVGDYDLHVMAVKGDPVGWNAVEYCCDADKPCDDPNPYPCDPDEGVFNACDSTLGAGVRFPTGFMASNQDCELADGHRYITEAQNDFEQAFDCVINVGRTGSGEQRYLQAMVTALSPSSNGPGGCNEGFLRPDAMLAVVIIGQWPDVDSPGTPQGLAASLIAAKSGYADGIVPIGIVLTDGSFTDGFCYDDPGDRTRQFLDAFPHHVLGSYCAPDMGMYLSQAVDVINTACESFVPPG